MSDAQQHLQKIRDQFTRQADAYIRMKQTTDEEALGKLAAMTGVQPDHRVLDVACGPGFLTMAFAQRCAEAVGLDATTEFLSRATEEAVRRGLRNIQFREGDAGWLPFADRTFDVVSCRAAFHHFTRPERVLAEMRRVLKPAGRIMIADMIASGDKEKAEYHNRVERLCDPTHVRALAESEFDRMFRDAGLEVLLRPKLMLHYDLFEWMGHGGPGEAAAREIVALMEASVDTDRTGLNVRREDGKLRFSHTAVAFLVQKE
jgi:ubiquinone/menaquinone biosynthesis C-methylase UbiE